MDNEGFYFSFEASVTLALILIIFLTPMQKIDAGMKEIFIQQKMHDALLIWAKQRNFNENELKSDFEFVFYNKSGSIEVESKIIEISGNSLGKEKFVETAYYVGDDLKYEKIVLTVFD